MVLQKKATFGCLGRNGLEMMMMTTMIINNKGDYDVDNIDDNQNDNDSGGGGGNENSNYYSF